MEEKRAQREKRLRQQQARKKREERASSARVYVYRPEQAGQEAKEVNNNDVNMHTPKPAVVAHSEYVCITCFNQFLAC